MRKHSSRENQPKARRCKPRYVRRVRLPDCADSSTDEAPNSVPRRESIPLPNSSTLRKRSFPLLSVYPSSYARAGNSGLSAVLKSTAQRRTAGTSGARLGGGRRRRRRRWRDGGRTKKTGRTGGLSFAFCTSVPQCGGHFYR